MDVYFSSDFHFGHHAILFHQKERRFSSVEEMDSVILDNVNRTVPADAILYFLGDFAWKSSMIGYYRSRINCRNIIFIRGNHDPSETKLQKHFSLVYDLHKFKINSQEIVLCHYAMKVWNKSHYGVWHLYGHSHGSLPDDPNALSLDVGIDCWGLRPISFDEVKEQMNKKDWKSIDHHL